MAFDKSLRILNYAKAVAGNLQLFTELDHSFEVGDRVYISGGYYDNVTRLFSPTAFNLFDQVSSGTHGYKVLQSNQNENSIVIEYDTTLTSIVYPYGNNANEYGDTSITGPDAAYLNDDDTTNFVYISKMVAANGKANNATINNGVFGGDDTKMTIKTTNITHIVAKNLESITSTITSKTQGNVSYVKKIRVIEDLSYVVSGEPFYILNDTVTLNNDEFGYSKFEKFKAITVNASNADFSDYKDGFQIDNLTLNKVKLGNSTFIKPGQHIVDNINATDSKIYVNAMKTGQNPNSAPTRTRVFNGCTYNNYVELSPTGVTIDTGGDCTFNVPYYTVASTNIQSWVGAQFFVNGVTKNGKFIDIPLTAEITGASYTFGNINSATIDMNFNNIDFDWSDVVNNPNDYDFSKIMISLNQYEAFSIRFHPVFFDMQKNNTIVANVKVPMAVGINEINPNNKFESSFVQNIKIHNNTAFNIYKNETSYVNAIGNAVKQFWFDDTVKVRATCQNGIIKNDSEHPLSFDYVNCNIQSGSHYDSTMQGCNVTVTNGFITYLADVNITATNIDNAVVWNRVVMQDMPYVNAGQVVFPSSIGERKTKFVTSMEGTIDSANLNMVKSIFGSYGSSNDYYNVLSKTFRSPDLGSKWSSYSTDLEVPGIVDFGGIAFDEGPVVIIDKGRMTYSTPADPVNGVWEINPNSKNVPLYVALTQSGEFLYDALYDKTNGVASPTSDYFGTNHPYPITSNVRDPYNVKANYVIPTINTVTLKPSELDAHASEVEVFQDMSALTPTFNDTPDPNNSANLELKFDLLALNTGVNVNNIEDGDTVTTSAGDKNVMIKLPNMTTYYNIPASHVQNCFFELEYVILEDKDTINNTTVQSLLNVTNYIPNNLVTGMAKYLWNNQVSYGLFEKNIELPIPTPIVMEQNHNYTIKMSVWFTWNYEWESTPLTQNGYIMDSVERGYRTRHEFTLNVECDGSTYFILAENGDFLVDENDENISWT